RGNSWGFRYAQTDRDAAAQALERVGLSASAHRPLRALSGGQRQRIRLARALAAEAELLLLDEPMTGIDPASEEQLLELLHELGRSRTIVMVSHDVACVSRHVRHVACCNHGITTHPVEDMTPERLLQSYRPGNRALTHDPASCPFHPPQEHVS
ncbi:MAG: ATP-binding cassette domain-containing protein, partial [Planctomycetota bacterium]